MKLKATPIKYRREGHPEGLASGYFTKPTIFINVDEARVPAAGRKRSDMRRFVRLSGGSVRGQRACWVYHA